MERPTAGLGDRDKELLRRRARRKAELIDVLAHELRDPRAPIGAALATLERAEPGDVRSTQAIDMVGRQLERLVRIVDEVARIERGEGAPSRDRARDRPTAPGGRVAPPSSGSRQTHRRRRVLVIEDRQDVAESLHMLLAIEGHEAQTACEGSAALALARTFQPEIVFCDLGLPGLDAKELARAMRADPGVRDAYLVALSGGARPSDSGFDLHIAKPAPLDLLAQVLASTPP